MLTDAQLERGKARLRLSQEILRDAISDLTQRATAERLGVNLNLVSFWIRALGVTPPLLDAAIVVARKRLETAREVFRAASEGLSSVDTARRLGLKLEIVEFWARALGVARTRQAGIGAGGSYDRQEIPRGL